MNNTEREIEEIAAAIIAASGAMPDPERHYQWLLGLKVEALRERLKIIRTEPKYPRVGKLNFSQRLNLAPKVGLPVAA